LGYLSYSALHSLTDISVRVHDITQVRRNTTKHERSSGISVREISDHLMSSICSKKWRNTMQLQHSISVQIRTTLVIIFLIINLIHMFNLLYRNHRMMSTKALPARTHATCNAKRTWQTCLNLARLPLFLLQCVTFGLQDISRISCCSSRSNPLEHKYSRTSCS